MLLLTIIVLLATAATCQRYDGSDTLGSTKAPWNYYEDRDQSPANIPDSTNNVIFKEA